ncbi:hypothetical protein SAMN05443144_10384 [Fodinibius roseus]|uniref:Uncharacterized protein n=1 Tax=Fodinibius roseus TaxID=1194090 RepID=A0A1M4W0E5_9BACT|nr:hypothetical protein SAMN05443144_10384 [Fodinibius roseus]
MDHRLRHLKESGPKKRRYGNAASAHLNRNNVGVLRLSDSQITFKKANAENYASWFENRLKFSGLP